MEKSKKMVPKIRFKGYSGEWEIRELKDISDKVTEKNKNFQSTETFTNSAEFGIVSQRDFFDKDISNFEKLNGYYVVRSDDFVYNPRISNFAPVGPIKRNKLNKIGVMSPLYYVFRAKSIDLTYLEKYFDTTYWHYFMKFNGDTGARSDRFSIKDSIFITMPIPYPKIDEQKLIGNFFQNIDKLIETRQSKLDKLRNIKKACLEKMFPKKGATVPEIRFKGFTEEWVENTIGEASFVYDGTHQTPKYTNSGIMFLSVENITNLKSNKFISLNDFKLNFKTYPENGDILMTRIGDIGTANVVETEQPIAYYVSLALLKKKELCPYFFKELIHSNEVQKRLWHRTLHIAFPKKINKNEIEKVELTHPSNFDEQNKIGTFFKNLDNLIIKNEQQLTKLKNIKKACLEKMFVNKEDIL